MDELVSRATIQKWGSLYDPDYDILLKQVRNTNTGESVNIAYSAAILHTLIPYFEETYPVRVNPKHKYGLDDTWQSAFMCIPVTDPKLVKALI